MLYLADFPRTPRQVRTALESRRLSQLCLARLTGVAPRTVRRWCDGRTDPDRPLPSGAVAMIGLALIRYDADAPDAAAAPSAPDEDTPAAGDAVTKP